MVQLLRQQDNDKQVSHLQEKIFYCRNFHTRNYACGCFSSMNTQQDLEYSFKYRKSKNMPTVNLDMLITNYLSTSIQDRLVSMNARDFSLIVTLELRNIYLKDYHLDQRYMPKLRRRYEDPEDLATANDNGNTIMNYGAIVEH